MLGQIIELNGIEYVIVSMKNHEDMGSCAYDREYTLVKYYELTDEMAVEINSGLYTIEVRGVTQLPFTVCKDKLHYDVIGSSDIKGKRVVHFERDFDSIEIPKVPSR